MLQNIYFIHSTGLCILNRRWGEIEFNEDLIAGFLTALKDFSAEVTGGRGAMKILDMKVYYILLVFGKDMLVAAAPQTQRRRARRGKATAARPDA